MTITYPPEMLPSPDEDQEAEVFVAPPPLCVFCGAPWTDDMVSVFIQSEVEHGYYPGEIDAVDVVVNIDVECSSCKRLVYRKEVVQRNPGYGKID